MLDPIRLKLLHFNQERNKIRRKPRFFMSVKGREKMKKILSVSIIAMMAITTANAEGVPVLATKNYVNQGLETKYDADKITVSEDGVTIDGTAIATKADISGIATDLNLSNKLDRTTDVDNDLGDDNNNVVPSTVAVKQGLNSVLKEAVDYADSKILRTGEEGSYVYKIKPVSSEEAVEVVTKGDMRDSLNYIDSKIPVLKNGNGILISSETALDGSGKEIKTFSVDGLGETIDWSGSPKYNMAVSQGAMKEKLGEYVSKKGATVETVGVETTADDVSVITSVSQTDGVIEAKSSMVVQDMLGSSWNSSSPVSAKGVSGMITKSEKFYTESPTEYKVPSTAAVHSALAKKFDNVAVPAECKADGVYCTMITVYDSAQGIAVPQWQIIDDNYTDEMVSE